MLYYFVFIFIKEFRDFEFVVEFVGWVPPIVTPIKLKNLLDDCKYWIKNIVFDDDEIAVRLSHRMVLIHPFANGNGRHSRLMADVLVNKGFGKSYFTWGSKNLVRYGEARTKYLEALRAADKNDYKPLIEFSRM